MANSRLDLKIIMSDHNLNVYDETEYIGWDCNHLMIECLIKKSVFYDDDIVDCVIKEIGDSEKNINYDFDVADDGLYCYQRILIPFGGHSGNSNIYYINTDKGFEIHKDEDSWTLNKNTKPDEIYSVFFPIYKTIINDAPNNCFWFDGYTFTLSDLITCFIKLETELITEFAKNCKLKCSTKYTDLESKLTLLSAAITTIDYLLQSNNWDEAQEILEKITSCSSLCDSDKPKNSCGCGRTL